ncbi:MAG: hypothetical protein ACJARO_001623 [Bacteriovoracaceae bacterium]|jgi:hypothetical protein
MKKYIKYIIAILIAAGVVYVKNQIDDRNNEKTKILEDLGN